MAGSRADGPLAAFKARFHDKDSELVARVANARWRVERLQKEGDDVLPAGAAASFREALQPVLQSLDDVKDRLLEADEKAEQVVLIPQEDSDDERYR